MLAVEMFFFDFWVRCLCISEAQVAYQICSLHKRQRWSRGHKARGQGQGHKKIRGQGQPFRGQTLSRPRTGMLEAKAKDTSASALQKKKKGLHKNFSIDLHKKTFSKKFFKRFTKF